ncbi:MAG: hypothetical protein EHM28_01915 [Spirochaetaceae bacterium]|nr:MAG: hypothetical protein EHM28_01915 [Spirochaetaceae bacterium]
MKLSLDTLGKGFSLSLKSVPNISAFLHLLIGMAGMVFMVVIGGLTKVPFIIGFFTIAGALFLLYCFFRSAYILNYMAIAELRDNKTVPHSEAGKAFNAQQIQVLLLPVIFAGTVFVEYLIFNGIKEIESIEGNFALSSILGSPFFIINMIIALLLILGVGIFLPIMIDQKKGAIGSIKSVVKMIKQQFLRVLVTQLAVILLVLVVFLLINTAFGFAGQPLVGSGNIFLPDLSRITEGFGNVGGEFAQYMASGNAVAIIFGILQMIFAVVIISAIAAYLFNLFMCLYSFFYLSFLKEHVNFNE